MYKFKELTLQNDPVNLSLGGGRAAQKGSNILQQRALVHNKREGTHQSFAGNKKVLNFPTTAPTKKRERSKRSEVRVELSGRETKVPKPGQDVKLPCLDGRALIRERTPPNGAGDFSGGAAPSGLPPEPTSTLHCFPTPPPWMLFGGSPAFHGQNL